MFYVVKYYLFWNAGVVQWLEFQPSKLAVWVRFPSPAPQNPLDESLRDYISKYYALIAQLDRASAF